MRLLSLALALSAIFPLWKSLPSLHDYVNKRHSLDLWIAQTGERICTHVRTLDKLEQQLERIRYLCQASPLPAQIPLRLQGQSLLVVEGIELARLEMLSQKIARHGVVTYAWPTYTSSLSCPPLPGPLRWSTSDILSFQNPLGGFHVFKQNWRSAPYWAYAHPGVRPL